MLHVAVTYRGRRTFGAFIAEENFAALERLHDVGKDGYVAALDASATPIVVRVRDLAELPAILGYSARPLAGSPRPDPERPLARRADHTLPEPSGPEQARQQQEAGPPLNEAG